MLDTAAAWADHLAATARVGLAGSPLAFVNDTGDVAAIPADERKRLPDTFADEYGFRRACDRPLLARLLDVDAGPPPTQTTADVQLWWALLAPIESAEADPWRHITVGNGPLLDGLDDVGIEARTEAELSALHALWNHVVRTGDDALRRRALTAVRWHLAEIQPDNATNRAWAVHAFATASLEFAGDEALTARLHAQTLASNCQVSLGRPDRFSSLLLLDAARVLRGL